MKYFESLFKPHATWGEMLIGHKISAILLIVGTISLLAPILGWSLWQVVVIALAACAACVLGKLKE